MEVVGAVLGGGVRAMSGSAVSSASAAGEQLASGNEVQQVTMKVLSAENDDHGGVIVEMKEAMDFEAFVSLLRASIAHWRQQVYGLWFLIFLWDFLVFWCHGFDVFWLCFACIWILIL